LIDLCKASQAHAGLLLAVSFVEVLKRKSCSDEVRSVLKTLVTLFAGVQIEKYSGELQEVGYLSGKQSQLVRSTIMLFLRCLERISLLLVTRLTFLITG